LCICVQTAMCRTVLAVRNVLRQQRSLQLKICTARIVSGNERSNENAKITALVTDARSMALSLPSSSATTAVIWQSGIAERAWGISVSAATEMQVPTRTFLVLDLNSARSAYHIHQMRLEI